MCGVPKLPVSQEIPNMEKLNTLESLTSVNCYLLTLFLVDSGAPATPPSHMTAFRGDEITGRGPGDAAFVTKDQFHVCQSHRVFTPFAEVFLFKWSIGVGRSTSIYRRLRPFHLLSLSAHLVPRSLHQVCFCQTPETLSGRSWLFPRLMFILTPRSNGCGPRQRFAKEISQSQAG